MEELYLLGQIAIFPWNWAPKNWAKCDGQLISISQNSALFSLIGTEFGGDRVTFALPKMPPIKTANADGGDLAYYICVNGIYPSRN
jgi:microcystin-dependent protein